MWVKVEMGILHDAKTRQTKYGIYEGDSNENLKSAIKI
jgi:hypothetical protein